MRYCLARSDRPFTFPRRTPALPWVRRSLAEVDRPSVRFLPSQSSMVSASVNPQCGESSNSGQNQAGEKAFHSGASDWIG